MEIIEKLVYIKLPQLDTQVEKMLHLSHWSYIGQVFFMYHNIRVIIIIPSWYTKLQVGIHSQTPSGKAHQKISLPFQCGEKAPKAFLELMFCCMNVKGSTDSFDQLRPKSSHSLIVRDEKLLFLYEFDCKNFL